MNRLSANSVLFGFAVFAEVDHDLNNVQEIFTIF